MRLERVDEENPFAYFASNTAVDWDEKRLVGPVLVLEQAQLGAVPEPSTYGLMGAALLLLAGFYRRGGRRT